MNLLLLALGGAGGAVARYLVDGPVADRTRARFPSMLGAAEGDPAADG